MVSLWAQLPAFDVGFLDPLFNAIGISGSLKQFLMIVIGAAIPFLYQKFVKKPDGPVIPGPSPTPTPSPVAPLASSPLIDDAIIERIAARVAAEIPASPIDIENDETAKLEFATSEAARTFGAGPIRNGIAHVREMLAAVKGEVEGIVDGIRNVNADLDGDGQPDGIDVSKFLQSVVAIVNKFVAIYPFLRVVLSIVGVKLPNIPLKPIVITPTVSTTLVAMQRSATAASASTSQQATV
jgi:hypothetical protein